MVKWGKCLKRSLCCGLALTLILSGTSCGKEEMIVDDYGVESDDSTEAVAENSEEEADGIVMGGRSLTEAFGENITVNDAFTVGGAAVSVSLDYQVPEESNIYVYEGGFIDETDDMEKQIVSSFFGGTEKNLEEIKYEDRTTYIPLLYKYRSLLELQSAEEDTSEDSFISISVIDSTFEEVYNWVDETTYSIHMYEGEYDGSRYGMIYSYDKARSTRYIYVCPISVEEYFPDAAIETMFVVDPGSEFGSSNLCSMSDTDIRDDARDVLGKLGLRDEDILLSYNPFMEIPEEGIVGTFGLEEEYNEMTKLVFSDTDISFSIGKLNRTNPTGHTYAFQPLTEQGAAEVGEAHSEDANITENGYAIYLCSEPFSDKIAPTELSTFNRGSIYYTDKGLFSVDISLVSEIDNVVEDVQLLSFDNIIECLKVAMEEDQVITQKSSGSLEVFSVDFTYVMVEDEENSGKITYVPAWYFVTEDKKLKSGEMPITYTHIINAIDGSNLKDKLR